MTTYKCLNRVTPKDDIKNTLKRNEKPIKQLFECELNKVSTNNQKSLKSKLKSLGN
jgi:hypothetical protein